MLTRGAGKPKQTTARGDGRTTGAPRRLCIAHYSKALASGGECFVLEQLAAAAEADGRLPPGVLHTLSGDAEGVPSGDHGPLVVFRMRTPRDRRRGVSKALVVD